MAEPVIRALEPVTHTLKKHGTQGHRFNCMQKSKLDCTSLVS
jgi:hypothetical protein